MFGRPWTKERTGLSGLQWSYVKKHYSLIPIYAVAIMGTLAFPAYIIRLLTVHPEISWRRHRNPEPWNDYSHKQFKMLSSGRDYTIPTPAPKYR